MNFFDNEISTLALKTKNKIIKEITQFKLFSYFIERSHQKQLLNYQNNSALTFPHYQNINYQLEHQGIFVTHLNKLDIDNATQLIESCLAILTSATSKVLANKKQYFILAEAQKIIEYPEIFTWGLDQKILATVSKYLSLPVAYHGIYLRRDLANNVVEKSRLWHLDKEDRKMFKIIIYLNDVDAQNGAFQYIPKSFTSDIVRQLRYNYEYLSAKKVERVLPDSEWVSCEGSAGTIIFVDTANIFHRGLVPQKSDRWSIFFDYTSAFPLRPYYCKSCFTLEDLLAFSSRLSSKQKECVFWNRKLKKALKRYEDNLEY